jgi:hypothetical protein
MNKSFVRVGLAVACCAGLAGCAVQQQAPTASPGVMVITEEPRKAGATVVWTPPPDPHPVKPEVILLGTSGGIDQVSQAVARVAGGGLEKLSGAGLEVDYIAPGYLLGLYGLPRGDPALAGLVVAAAHQVRPTPGLEVYASPNYPLLLADDGIPVGSSPWYIGGSPWYIGGSPWYVGGSPSVPSATAAPNKAHFANQWAFGAHPGIGLTATAPSESQAVVAYVLDSSTLPVGNHGLGGGPGTLQVSAPAVLGNSAPASPGPCTATPHGLFVAGLLHAVAPAATIRLIPVLDACGVGELANLQAGLHSVRQVEHGDKDSVLNLSLGVELDSRTKEAFGVAPGQLKGWCDKLFPEDVGAAGDCAAATKRDVAEITTLMKHLEALDREGTVIVAAAGNGSESTADPVPMQLPAAYDFVIGVIGTTRTGGVACYSNEEKAAGRAVKAPGGAAVSDMTSGCPRPANGGQGDPNCQYGITSLVGINPDYYGCWQGTSFAAPQVSGLAAQCLTVNSTWQPQAAPAMVWKAISTPAAPSGGVIKVQPSLLLCPP